MLILKPAAIVGIDVGGHHSKHINDIGIAIFPNFPETFLSRKLHSVGDLYTEYGAEVHLLKIEGRKDSRANGETCEWGDGETIPPRMHLVEERLVKMLEGARSRAQQDGGESSALWCLRRPRS